jgi:glycosyltransferase involved in cell wall biosynthesis
VADRTRILLLIPRLQAGGAEQVMTLVARGLSREKYEVHLCEVTADGKRANPLPEWVTTHSLGAGRARHSAIPLLRLVWRIRPSVILSSAPEISFVVLLLRQFFPSGTRVLVRQNGTVSAALAMGGVPRYTRLLYRLLYWRADRVICQTRAMAADLAAKIGVPREKIVVLANPVDLDGVRVAKVDASEWSGAGPHLLAVGRLSQEKGFDLLIEAFAGVHEKFSSADLTIVGAGGEESALKTLCRNSNLENAVRFAGRVDQPYSFFRDATLFVLSSRHEGMPNALLEAAAAGLPVVATPASGGVVDLLRGRRGMWLAQEVSSRALGEAIVAALQALKPGERFDFDFLPPLRREEPKPVA